MTRFSLDRLVAAEAVAAALLLSACGGGTEPLAAQAGPAPMTRADSPSQGDAVPPEHGLGVPAAAAGAEREAAQALSFTCTPEHHAMPKVAAYDMSRSRTAERQALLARFGFVVVNVPYRSSAAETNAFTGGIKAINPRTTVAQFINFPDLRNDAPDGEYARDLAFAVTANGWWLRDAAGQLVSWDGAAYGVNVTTWAPANAAGQRYPQYKARYDHDAYLAGRTGVDYVFSANTFAQPRVVADWRRTKTNQLRSDPTVQSAMRAGYAAYWQSLRALQPGVRIMGGLDNSNDLSSPEHKDMLDGAYLDGMIGKSWSLETGRGWEAMMERYRAVRANTRGDKAVLFSVYGDSPLDYATMRYGLASALLDDGHFMFRPSSGSSVPAWYDEYSARLGGAIEPPPLEPAANGVYLRRYRNGLVLVNPGQGAATIDVGPGYQRLAGTQDPAVNNGRAESVVTLPPRSGLLMLKVPVPCTKPAFRTPKIAALDYSKDTSSTNRAFLAQFDYVLIGLSKSQGASKMTSFTSGLKKLNPNLRLGHYVIVNEAKCTATTSDDYYDLWSEIDKANWWLRHADGTRSQWTTTYKACDINLTGWGVKNAAGQTWHQYKWQRDWNVFFKNMPAADFVHVDNMFRQYRKDADFRRIGTNQPHADAVNAAAWRAGMMAYVAQVRTHQPHLQISVNADSDLSQPEYKGKFDFAFLEGVIGKSWSKETRSWDEALAYYRGALANAKAPGSAILQTFAAPTDHALVRYGLATAMLDDGYFMQTNNSGSQRPSWFDEFEAPIGTAVEAPPKAPAHNGVWLRKYQNGLVLVNPSKTASATIDVGAGYKRLAGSQDPAVNHGGAERVVTLPPRSGLLMLKQ